jgi:hypothetical protein
MRRKFIIGFISTLFIASLCQSQRIQYQTKLLPKVKQKLDSLYPNATEITFTQYPKLNTSQKLWINCNCPESSEDGIILTFDTNGNLLNKDITLHEDIKSLPDSIISYIKIHTTSDIGFYNNYFIKSINNKGEISYSIVMWEKYPKISLNTDRYILKFKSTGELISKEKQPILHD